MSRRTFRLVAMAIALLAVTACSDEGAGPTSTPPSGTQPATSTPLGGETTTTGATDRVVEVVTCDAADEAVAVVCEAFDLIKTEYVDPLSDADLAAAASRGLADLDGADGSGALVCAAPVDAFVEVCQTAGGEADDSVEAAEAMVTGITTYALDPNSAYLDEEALELLDEQQQGEIQGIGALVSPEDQTIPGDDKQCALVSETCRLHIVSTIPGAPAEKAGLERGDIVVAVDGESVIGWTVDEVTARVRGPAGSEVRLTLERDGAKYMVTITREAVVIPVVDSETFDDVGYLALNSFTGSASAQFERAVVDLLADGVEELVIDLRNNPGGFLTTAIEVTSVFLEDGDVVVTQGPDETTTYPVEGDAIVPDEVEVTMVVNEGSASASEVVAATLQEAGRVTVVGENTFGKNTVQQRFSLSNGGALKLTIARWLTPGGHDFGGTGVTPDVAMDVTDLSPQELVAAIVRL